MRWVGLVLVLTTLRVCEATGLTPVVCEGVALFRDPGLCHLYTRNIGYWRDDGRYAWTLRCVPTEETPD